MDQNEKEVRGSSSATTKPFERSCPPQTTRLCCSASSMRGRNSEMPWSRSCANTTFSGERLLTTSHPSVFHPARMKREERSREPLPVVVPPSSRPVKSASSSARKTNRKVGFSGKRKRVIPDRDKEESTVLVELDKETLTGKKLDFETVGASCEGRKSPRKSLISSQARQETTSGSLFA